MDTGRLADAERRIDELTERVRVLEGRRRPNPGTAPAVAPASPPPDYWVPAKARAPQPAAAAHQAAPRTPMIELTASRVLAIAGGIVLLLGIGFLVRYALTQGWLGPTARMALALIASGTVAAVGLRLERKVDTRGVGQICTATGAAGAYTTIVAATAGYTLIPHAVGVLAACSVAAAVLARGVWSRNQWGAALGVGASLAAPAIVGAAPSVTTLGLLTVVAAVAVVVAVRCAWPALALLAFAMVTPQVWLIADAVAQLAIPLALTAAVGGLFLAAAVAADPERASAWQWAPALLAVANAMSVATTGWFLLDEHLPAGSLAGAWWVAAVAAVHLGAAAVAALRERHTETSLALAAAGVLLADAAIGLFAEGHAVIAAMVAFAAALAAVTTGQPRLVRAGQVAVGVQLAAIAIYGLAVHVDLPAEGSGEAVAMVAGLSAAGMALALITRHLGRGMAIVAGAVLLGVATARLLLVDAPLSALLDGPEHLVAALTMSAAIGTAAACLGWLVHPRFTQAAAVVANYGVSLAAVAMDPDGAGRVALTALWALGGAAALTVGRRVERRDLRRGGAALLAAAVAKAALVDTVMLDGTNRAVALLLCGAVLVATAIAEARAAGTTAATPRTDSGR